MAQSRSVTVTSDDIGRRLDNFMLTALNGVPRSRVYRMIRSGEVRVNSGRASQGYRLLQGDVIRIPPFFSDREQIRPTEINQALKSLIEENVLFENENLLILNKPAGIPVHGGSNYRFGIIEIVRAIRKPSVTLAHRLDRDTSGCLAIVKSSSLLRQIHAALREGAVDKEYQGLVKGVWRGGARFVEGELKKGLLQGGERMVQPVDDGKPARTWMCPMQRFSDATLMRIKPLTGRTHQIRVHAASLGHPLAGDAKYGERAFNRRMRGLGLGRLFLHASRFSFRIRSPPTAHQFDAPLPSELTRVVERLCMHQE
ncbi:MAG: RluA family pseudouridine synthase [Gammaproteobacteria bacterium]